MVRGAHASSPSSIMASDFPAFFFLQVLETSCDFLASMRAQFLQLSAFSSQLVMIALMYIGRI